MKIRKIKENCNSDMKSRGKKAIEDYRVFANVAEDFTITEENLDTWALNEAAVKNGIQRYDLRHMILGEDVTLDQASRELEAEIEDAATKSEIEQALDTSLKLAKRMQSKHKTEDFPNILLSGDAGFGKTAIVKEWARKNNINLVYKDAKTMDAMSLGGVVVRDKNDDAYATRLGSKEFHVLDKPNSVLFLDEYNRARAEIRGSLLTLIQDHVIWDPAAEGEMRFLPNFLFTVAACNPANSAYPGAKELDAAEASRFNTIPVQGDPRVHLNYLRKDFGEMIEDSADDPEEQKEYRGMLALAEKILTYPEFGYDTTEEISVNSDSGIRQSLNYRTLRQALLHSGGTKEGLLKVWNQWCNPKKKHDIEEILSDYVDVQDKANDALTGGTSSAVFGRASNILSKLNAAYPGEFDFS